MFSRADRPPMRVFMARWRAHLMVLTTALLVVFFQLGNRGLNEPDEGRYAEVAREMVESGNYMVPHLNGKAHFTKPPLTYWVTAISLKILGVNETAARLPSALAALGILWALYLIAAATLGESTGLWAVMVLLTSVLFTVTARLITTDMLLTCWVTWSVWALWRWYTSEHREWRRLIPFYICLGLGFMTKGPVAVVLPLFALAGLRWRNPALSVKSMGWGRGLLVFLAVATPWFLLVTATHPGLMQYFLGHEVVDRVASNTHGRSKPWWFFLLVLPAALLPWTPWLLVGRSILREQRDQRADLVRMCLGWVALGLVLFSVSRSKLPTYIVPLCPPLALLVAIAIGSLVKQAGQPSHWRQLLAGGIASSLLLVVTAAGSIVALVLNHVDHPIPTGIPLLVIATVGFVGVVTCLRMRRAEYVTVIIAGTVVATTLTTIALLPRVERNLANATTARFFAERIEREDPQQEQPVIVTDVHWSGLAFYLNRPVVHCELFARVGTSTTAAYDDDHDQGISRYRIDENVLMNDYLTGSKPAFFIVENQMLKRFRSLAAGRVVKLETVNRSTLCRVQSRQENVSP